MVGQLAGLHATAVALVARLDTLRATLVKAAALPVAWARMLKVVAALVTSSTVNWI